MSQNMWNWFSLCDGCGAAKNELIKSIFILHLGISIFLFDENWKFLRTFAEIKDICWKCLPIILSIVFNVDTKIFKNEKNNFFLKLLTYM